MQTRAAIDSIMADLGGEGGITRRSAPRPFGAALIGVFPRKSSLSLSSGGEGGITRRSAPRPFGAALRALSPLRCPRYQLIQTNENLPNAWRRGWDSNPRTRLGVTHFPGVRLRPLGHLSINLNLLQPPGGIARGGRRSSPAMLGTPLAQSARLLA